MLRNKAGAVILCNFLILMYACEQNFSVFFLSVEVKLLS